ncbi:MAG: hypothetical protein MI807_07515, partial [Verrucomicrobiales bacterium]|nr:hypothetical protein [Verrucomicrobiales bacterium]
LLYARFVSRSRANSFVDGESDLPPIESERGIIDEISGDEAGPAPVAEGDTLSETEDATPECFVEEKKESVAVAETEEPAVVAEKKEVTAGSKLEPSEAPVRVAMLHHEPSTSSAAKDEEMERKGEYLDELQEAAAGLAMLMRSSPVSARRDPVVFAPAAGEESESVTGLESESESVNEEAELLQEVAPAEVTETADEEEVISEVSTEEEAQPVVAEPESAPASRIISLLGEEVSDQMKQIDSGLDELEELVNGIETSLAALTLPEWEEEVEIEQAA